MQSIIPTLMVSSIEESIRFYTDALGFSVTFTMPGDGGELVHASVRRGDAEIMFGPISMLPPDDRGHLGKGVSLYMTVGDDEDIDLAFERAKGAGAKVVQEPADQFWGHRDWSITDPDGYALYVSKVVRNVSAEEMQQHTLAAAPAD